MAAIDITERTWRLNRLEDGISYTANLERLDTWSCRYLYFSPPPPARDSEHGVDLESPPVDKNMHPALLSFYSSTPAEQVDSDSHIYFSDFEHDTLNHSAQVHTTPFPRKEAPTRNTRRIRLLESGYSRMFEWRAGGYHDSPGEMPRVLIEGKPVLRPLNLLPIQFQESAQMVAWIKGDTELSQKINTMYALPSPTASQI